MKPHFELEAKTIFGGKGAAGVCHHIINQIPKHDTYVEGFLGLGRVLRYKKLATRSVGVDMDSTIIDLWGKNTDLKNINLTIQKGDFLRLAKMVQLLELLMSPTTYLYLDPPYPHSTRKSKKRYKYELSDKQHIKLLKLANQFTCMVGISTYEENNHIYKKQLKDWRKIRFPSTTRGGVRIETLYMNYKQPLPSQLHDTRFVGGDFRQREKTKRRLETIKGKIRRLEDFEQARLVDELLQEFDFLK